MVDDSHRNYDISLKDDNSGDDNDCLLIDENESVLIRVISHATLYILFVMTVTVFTMVVTAPTFNTPTTNVYFKYLAR